MSLLQDFVGKTKTQNLIDDVGKIYKENLCKDFPEFYAKENNAKAYCVVTALEETEIKNIGMSKTDDLLNNNFAQFLGMLLLTRQENNAVMQDTGGVFQNFRVWGNGNNARSFAFAQVGSSAGMIIQTGSSATTPLRTDFNLTNAVQTMISGFGGYNSGLGKVQMPSSAVSLFNTTIAEAGLFFQGNFALGNAVLFKTGMWAHDLINPVVPVTIGQAINADYEFIIT